MGTFLFILFLILGLCEILWYLTCTEHKNIPLLFVLLDIFTVFCPILNACMFIVNLIVLYQLVDTYSIKLKYNWFNRVFLAHHE